MPIYEFECLDCGRMTEILVRGSEDEAVCEYCGSKKLQKILSAPSTASGASQHRMPGPGDTTCCGSNPGAADCAGPGSCCGRRTP